MPDDRTERQKKADVKLQDAIEEVAAAYDEGDGAFLMEWLVICANHLVLEDGGTATGIDFYVSEDLPHYRMMGLISYMDAQVRHRVTDCRQDEQ